MISCLCIAVTTTKDALQSMAIADSRTILNFRQRSFSVSGPQAWNGLPKDITIYISRFNLDI